MHLSSKKNIQSLSITDSQNLHIPTNVLNIAIVVMICMQML